MKVLTVIPAYNEEQTIAHVIRDVRKYISESDILVVNDFSSDNTKEIVSQEKDVILINNIFNMGYALSVQTGIMYARDNGYDYVIQIDADGQHPASEAKKMLALAKKEKIDIILGSRYLNKECGYKIPLFRRVGTKMFEWSIRVFCSTRIKDPLTGLQCINRKTICQYSAPGFYPEYPDAGLLIKMLMNGSTIREVPVKMKERENGVSMHAGIIKPMKYMLSQMYVCFITFLAYVGKRRKHE